MIFKYNPWLNSTWKYNGNDYQMDPLGLVPSPENKDILIPLYNLLGMTKEEARTIAHSFRLQQVRDFRNGLIANTDWWMLSDRNPTEAQITYRQALRDITKDFDCEAEIIFPPQP